MKNILILFLFLSIFDSTLFSQTIRIQGAYITSKIQSTKKDVELGRQNYTDPIHTFRPSIGVDFFERKYYNVSATVGLTRKGGVGQHEETVWGGDIRKETFETRIDYVSMSLAFEGGYPIHMVTPFVSAGPRFDYMTRFSQDQNRYMKEISPYNYSFGINVGGGFKFNYGKYLLGARYDHLYSFTPVHKLPGSFNDGDDIVTDRTYSVTAFIGYRFRG
jgi:hypothetical protein